jgi:hypothetical protein
MPLHPDKSKYPNAMRAKPKGMKRLMAHPRVDFATVTASNARLSIPKGIDDDDAMGLSFIDRVSSRRSHPSCQGIRIIVTYDVGTCMSQACTCSCSNVHLGGYISHSR